MRFTHPFQIKGVTVVEILIGVSLFALIVVFITHTLALYFSTGSLLQEKTKALYLAQEGQEVMRYLRDEDWTTLTDLTVGTTYYFAVSTTTLATTTATELIQGVYTRSIVLENAYRDGNDDLVESTAPGASVDVGGRIVVTTVQWGVGNEVELESLLTNIFDI